LKILYHHRTQAEDAQGVHIYELVRAFKALGHEVEIASLVKLDENTLSKTKGAKWNWIARLTPGWFYELMGLTYNLLGYRMLLSRIKSSAPDMIYERYSLNTLCGIWASRRCRIPIVLEVNAPLYHEQKQLGALRFRSLARYSERWACSNSTWTITVSEVLKSILTQEGVPAKKIVVMPNGIDTNKFNPHVSGKTIRKKYGIDSKTVLGFVGWFRPWHGLDKLMRSMHEFRFADKGLDLLLVGDGPAYGDLYTFAEKKGLLSNIHFTGPVPHNEIPNYIAAMDIVIQPFATEYACPMKIIEYLGMGKCIVAIDQANIRELIEDGVTGFLFKNTKTMASIITKLISNPQLRMITGQKAIESIAKRELLWKGNARKTLSLIMDDGSEM